MARIVNTFPINPKGPQFRGDPQWFNGEIWELDIDFDLDDYATPKVARSALVQYARKRGMKLRTSLDVQNRVLVIQASHIPMPPPTPPIGANLDEW